MKLRNVQSLPAPLVAHEGVVHAVGVRRGVPEARVARAVAVVVALASVGQCSLLGSLLLVVF